MTPNEFKIFLDGFVLFDKSPPTQKQWAMILQKLDSVLELNVTHQMHVHVPELVPQIINGVQYDSTKPQGNVLEIPSIT